jgi:hypothetical protein
LLLDQHNLTPAPAPSARSVHVLGSLDAFDSAVEVVEAPPAPKSSPFFQGKTNRKASLTSARTARAAVDDSLDDIDWDAWDADVLDQTSSSAAVSSRKRSLDMAGGASASKKRSV